MEERDIVVLLKAGAIRQVAARPSSDGSWVLLVNDEPVGSARNQVRPFKTLDAVAKVAAKLGIERFEVTTQSEQIRPGITTRPDTLMPKDPARAKKLMAFLREQ